jgi:hypothetical protein
MERHNIKWINTLSYSPQSNGLIENFNNQLRKMLREIMIRHNDLVWWNQLDLCCSIKNRQRNSTTKKRPIDVWEATNFRRLRPMRNQEVAENIKEKARQNVLKNKTIEFNVNDYVRVKLSQLYSQVPDPVADGKIDPLQQTNHTPAGNVRDKIAATVPVCALIGVEVWANKYPPNWVEEGNAVFGVEL